MQQPKFNLSLLALSLSVALGTAVSYPASAALKRVNAVAPAPQAEPYETSSSDEAAASEEDSFQAPMAEQVVIEKLPTKAKAPKTAKANGWKRVSAPVAAAPAPILIKQKPVTIVAANDAVEPEDEDLAPLADLSDEPLTAAPKKKGVGARIDTVVDKKLNNTRGEVEDTLVKAVEDIQISVKDGRQRDKEARDTYAPIPAAPIALAPQETAVVKDKVIQTSAATSKEELAINGAEESEAELKAQAEQSSAGRRFSIMPLFGMSLMGDGETKADAFKNSASYKVNSKSAMGASVEVDMNNYFSAAFSYLYSRYDVNVNGNPYAAPGVNVWNGAQWIPVSYVDLNRLEYNQNTFDLTGRFYLFPQDSAFRPFVGGGIGYNRGFLNYQQSVIDAFKSDAAIAGYGLLDDYTVSSFYTQLLVGGDVRVVKGISLGALFRFNKVLGASNEGANNPTYMYVRNSPINDKRPIGAAVGGQSFYSILATLKISF